MRSERAPKPAQTRRRMQDGLRLNPEGKASNMKQYEFTKDQRMLIEAMRQPFVVCQIMDKRVVPLAVSDGFCRLFGYQDRAQAYADMNQNMYKDVHPDDAARFTSALLQFVTEGGRLEIIYRTRKRTAPGTW